MWDVLQRRGDELEVMKLERSADGLLLYGAKGDQSTAGREKMTPDPALETGRHLAVVYVDQSERIVRQQIYSALPDVHEIFSTRSTAKGEICIAYGEQRQGEELLNPVLVRLDAKGKIAWASREIISARHKTAGTTDSLEQVANFDTIQVGITPDNGCLLAFVTRVVTRDGETFRLSLIHHTSDGTVQWRKSVPTALYGRMFMLHDVAAKRYVMVQTNQSRDAAIAAMLQGVPFKPHTVMTGFDNTGEVVFHTELAGDLGSVWVNGVVPGPEAGILLVGKLQAAWAGNIATDGELLGQFSSSFKEFNAVTKTLSGNFAFAGAESLVVTDNQFRSQHNININDTITQQFVNQFLASRLPDDVPVEQIVAWHPREFLLLYKLGSRLVKVVVPAKTTP